MRTGEIVGAQFHELDFHQRESICLEGDSMGTITLFYVSN